ncbi:MAG: MATE family efflux transporter [Candidatus Riflebacteria bacterium]|nr:MATE family efflux transporter [Candidatus Riflebacteria bacterium]
METMKGTDLTTGSIWRHLIVFSVPMLVGSLMQTAYSVINAIWVGNGLGAESMAAIAVSFPLIFLLVAVVNGLSMGSSVLVSQHYGAKNLDKVTEVINNAFVIGLLISGISMVVGYYGAEPILKLNGTPTEVLPIAASYMRYFVGTFPSMFGIFMLAACLRGTGDSKTPLYFQAGGLLVACILDPVLMFGWLGAPKMGLNGAALATILAQTGGFLGLLYYLHRKRHLARPRLRGFRLDRGTIWLILVIGVPSTLQQALVSVGMVLIIGLVNGFGKDAVAAYGAAMRIDQIAFMPAMTIGMAISTVAGQNIGAGLFDRVKRTFWVGVALGVISTLPATLLALVVPEVILRLFLQEPEVLNIGCHYLHIMGLGYLIFSIMFVSNGVINGAGKTFVTTLVSLIALWGIRIPLATYLSKTSLHIEGIWYSIVFSSFIGMSISLLYFASGRWRVKLVSPNKPSVR